MRLLGSFQQKEQADRFSLFLRRNGIEHSVDMQRNNDWTSNEYGTISWIFWIVKEEEYAAASSRYDAFLASPEDTQFPSLSEIRTSPSRDRDREVSQAIPLRKLPLRDQPIGPLTWSILLLCIALFLLSRFLAPPYTPHEIPNNLPTIALFASPITKTLLYDFPKTYALTYELAHQYGLQALSHPEQLPPSGKKLLLETQATPYWQGAYALALKTKSLAFWDWTIAAPLFEKIREGQLWRSFTPALLHADLLHLFFNMLWFIVLGKQLEQRIGLLKMLFFVLFVGILSNTMQYGMSGANFIGFSGILCGMLTFIWVRLHKAPWEGYQLPEVTIGLMIFFILAMFVIQLVSFFTEFHQLASFSPGIANTAHLSGAAIGVVLGTLPFFSWKPQAL